MKIFITPPHHKILGHIFHSSIKLSGLKAKSFLTQFQPQYIARGGRKGIKKHTFELG
jgi:hypothetical protein